MILTLKEMQDRLAQITYKEGWKFRLYEGHTEGIHLEILADIEDSFNKGQTVRLEVYSAVPSQLSIQSFDLWLFERIKRLEIHECMEFLQVDGKAIFNPHRENADRDILC